MVPDSLSGIFVHVGDFGLSLSSCDPVENELIFDSLVGSYFLVFPPQPSRFTTTGSPPLLVIIPKNKLAAYY
jgi:hypothetical protein